MKDSRRSTGTENGLATGHPEGAGQIGTLSRLDQDGQDEEKANDQVNHSEKYRHLKSLLFLSGWHSLLR